MTKQRGFTMIELMIVVAILGIIAATAIPSYMRYIRRSYTIEAPMNLRRMYDGAVAYYLGEHSDITGKILARQLPGSAGPTPLLSLVKGVKYQPTAADFGTPEWNALDFGVKDPLRYSYSFTDLSLTSALMIANGDLNGNGIPSVFQRAITGSPSGVEGGGGLNTLNELE